MEVDSGKFLTVIALCTATITYCDIVLCPPPHSQCLYIYAVPFYLLILLDPTWYKWVVQSRKDLNLIRLWCCVLYKRTLGMFICVEASALLTDGQRNNSRSIECILKCPYWHGLKSTKNGELWKMWCWPDENDLLKCSITSCWCCFLQQNWEQLRGCTTKTDICKEPWWLFWDSVEWFNCQFYY